MKYFTILLLILTSLGAYSQKKEKINIPERVKYKYCSGKKFGKAQDLLLNELVKNNPTYEIVKSKFFIGPVMWERLSKIEDISKIKAGTVHAHVNNAKLEGKLVQTLKDGKIIWNQIRSEFNGVPMRLRKATYDELDYFWTVIFYDIEEPLIIGETSNRTYIFDLDPKTFRLIWMDEVPEDIKAWYKSTM